MGKQESGHGMHASQHLSGSAEGNHVKPDRMDGLAAENKKQTTQSRRSIL
jgi:hypothetical protein